MGQTRDHRGQTPKGIEALIALALGLLYVWGGAFWSAKMQTQNTNVSHARNLSTDELAAKFHVRPQTIRSGLCRNGHYLGLRPIKLGNRLLLWPAAEAERLISGEVK